MAGQDAPLLEVERFQVSLKTNGRIVRPVEELSFRLERGRTLGIVGESGSGKSMSVLGMLGLIPKPPLHAVSGSVRFNGMELTTLPPKAWEKLRGRAISMIFQEPQRSLDPLFTIGSQMTAMLRTHERLSPVEARQRAMRLLREVRIAHAEDRLRAYPHQISGGMAQRVVIATAIAAGPELLVADEPTTALDVTTQAESLRLLRRLQRDRGMSMIFISHNLGVVAKVAHDVLVMYAGEMVEKAPTRRLFFTPAHPYTKGLIGSIPTLGERVGRLRTIPGTVPSLDQLPPGCRFAPRCAWAQSVCREQRPEWRALDPEHWVRCHFAEQVAGEGSETR